MEMEAKGVPWKRRKENSGGYAHSDQAAADDEEERRPLSPRVRKRLDDAKENANLFGPGELFRMMDGWSHIDGVTVCEQGEVIQWMTACHPDLLEFGQELERRGFRSLSSIAFLTEEDLDPSIAPATKQLLMATLSRLRHEYFRM
ncbi:TPA: hypothetical protein N0F65_008717 [Lagenidium giganteum]|uniref:SAM domain-containing protein n=1 Tax=Lagenidium giganteum TaxID=4803 RepID=A0AAV2YQR9_9STRA|nr:TPA: hypothetical protein N0F65_008717 [Lagenidium giganteum]